jgi:hypothetical protein
MKTLATLALGLLLHFTGAAGSGATAGQTLALCANRASLNERPIRAYFPAEKFYKATIVFTDGHEAEGLVTLPEKCTDETIRYKENDDAKAVKYKSEELARLVFPEADGNNVIFERVLAQKGPATKKTMVLWLRVARRGFATLYFCDVKSAMGTGGGMIVGYDRYWFVKREEEVSASIVSWQGYGTNEHFFRKKAGEYFKDDAELAAKIEDKQFKREDIYKLLDEYNAWKEKNG